MKFEVRGRYVGVISNLSLEDAIKENKSFGRGIFFSDSSGIQEYIYDIEEPTDLRIALESGYSVLLHEVLYWTDTLEQRLINLMVDNESLIATIEPIEVRKDNLREELDLDFISSALSRPTNGVDSPWLTRNPNLDKNLLINTITKILEKVFKPYPEWDIDSINYSDFMDNQTLKPSRSIYMRLTHPKLKDNHLPMFQIRISNHPSTKDFIKRPAGIDLNIGLFDAMKGNQQRITNVWLTDMEKRLLDVLDTLDIWVDGDNLSRDSQNRIARNISRSFNSSITKDDEIDLDSILTRQENEKTLENQKEAEKNARIDFSNKTIEEIEEIKSMLTAIATLKPEERVGVRELLGRTLGRKPRVGKTTPSWDGSIENARSSIKAANKRIGELTKSKHDASWV